MTIIILGLLMLKKMTIYEMRYFIEENLMSISSNSMGSIQAAIKKLLESNMIAYHEHVENGLNKKLYEITDEGRAYFNTTIQTPMKYKDKNMELSKLLFMGFAKKEMWNDLIDSYIEELTEKQDLLIKLRSSKISVHEIDEGYLQELMKISSIKLDNDTNPLAYIQGISFFQLATLDYSIDKINFEINWFKNLKEKISEKEII